MDKIWLIIKREYLTRVRNKTFILSTFLLPIVMIGFIGGVILLTVKSVDQYKIAVNDASGMFRDEFKSSKMVLFDYRSDINEKNYMKEGYSGILMIPVLQKEKKDTIRLISEKQLGLMTDDAIRKEINKAVEDRMFQDRGIDRRVIDSIRERSENSVYEFKSLQVKGGEVKESNSGRSYGIGFACGILIYITLFIYGAAVMRGVMEEKMNRIAEVMISSAKPFQLMMGKIIGIAAVSLTQFLMWIVLMSVLSTALTAFIPHDMIQQAQQVNQNMPNMAQNNSMAFKILEFKNVFADVNWGLLLFCFLYYFLGGYLFYSALFAAVGSVVNEDPQEAQALMLPITMPIILSFIVMSIAASTPSSPVAVWGSIIPFSSPIVMMARIPYGVPGTVPYWQLALSMVLLFLGFLFTTWMSAKIYRTGILLYGKKVNFRELGRWAFRRS
jgi:ABC-2 type transport system permease protein